MRFINTDGMSFIGPGSEWFWTALSGIVLAVTFLAIYRQLRLQASQSAIEQLERIEQDYASERLARHRLALLLALRDGVGPADLPNHGTAPIINFWERVGSLARRGHLDLDLLWEGGSGFYCQADWVRLAPAIQKNRIEDGNPEIAEYFEWLARQMEAKAKRVGVKLSDATSQAANLDRAIANTEHAIRIEVALRSAVTVAPDDAVATPVTSPAPAGG